METKGAEYKVGIFIGAGLLLLMITIVFLGGTKRLLGSTYNLYLSLDAVDGLGPGSVVQLAGLPVGNVEKIEFNDASTSLKVVLRIQTEFQGRITQGSTGTLRTQGALGDKFVFVNPGPTDKPSLKSGEWLIPSKGSDLFSTLSETGPQIQKVFKVLDEVHTLVANLNASDRSAIFAKNLADGSGQFREAMGKFNSVMSQIESETKDGSFKTSLSSLSSILTKIDRGTGTLGVLVNDPSIADKLKEIVGGGQRDKYLKSVIRESLGTVKK